MQAAAIALQAGMIVYLIASLSLSTEYQKVYWLQVFLSVVLANMRTRWRATPVQEESVPVAEDSSIEPTPVGTASGPAYCEVKP